MTLEMGFVLLVIFMMMIGLVLELARPDLIVFGTLVLFIVTPGILTVEEGIRGFSNEGMLTIALLFLIAAGIQKSGLVHAGLTKLMGQTKRASTGMMLQLYAPISGVSAFLNNTPIVVTLAPIIRKWCMERGISPSKLLIPLSYAAILGGTMTIMGTSTNLVVHGLMLEWDMIGFSFFELGIVGVPVTLVGLLYITTIGYRLLPNNKGLTETVQEHSREYISEMYVTEEYPFLNHMVKEAGLRNLKGLFLLEIVRGDERISPVSGSTRIEAEDRLIFTGLISTIAELQKRKGLVLVPGAHMTLDDLNKGTSHLAEAVISHQSSLAYKRLKDSGFRSRFDAGVIAVHRNNERIQAKIGDIVLKPGDTLLLLGGPDFEGIVQQSNDFYIVTPLHTPPEFGDRKKGWLSLAFLMGMIGFVVTNVLSMFQAMCIVAVGFVATKVITPEEAKQSVHFSVLLLIASAFGIGTALVNTGAAKWLAQGLLGLIGSDHLLLTLICLYLLTNVFTEVITNSAAAVLMFPIGIELANQLSINPHAVAVLIAIAASASFITPIGYQTNLIVYGPGGYKFTDYMKIGIPLSILVMVTTVTIVSVVWL